MRKPNRLRQNERTEVWREASHLSLHLCLNVSELADKLNCRCANPLLDTQHLYNWPILSLLRAGVCPLPFWPVHTSVGLSRLLRPGDRICNNFTTLCSAQWIVKVRQKYCKNWEERLESTSILQGEKKRFNGWSSVPFSNGHRNRLLNFTTLG